MINDQYHIVRTKNSYEIVVDVGELSDMAWDHLDVSSVPGGSVRQILTSLVLDYEPFSTQLLAPTLDDFNVDWNKGDYRRLIINTICGLDTYKKQNNRCPSSWNEEDASKLIGILEAKVGRLEESEQNFVKKFSFTCRGRLVGNDSILGGFVAQEVVKAVGRKYTPVKQWFFHEALELLPSLEQADPTNYREQNDRYDSLRVVVGDTLVNKIHQTSLFMIGCGAIGCELMKIYAMLGVSTGQNAYITVTDNDFIEKSNLNRQFLFRKDDLDQPKSSVAARAIVGMNSDVHVKSYTVLVTKETEDVFSDDFFQKQTLIVNALDNVEARLYVDSRCVENRKVLLESGTKGPMGHTMSIVPDLTVNYGYTRDAPDPDFPGCTVKYFPFKSVHTIQWAKQKFQKLFEQMPQECNRVREDSKGDGWWDRLRAVSPTPLPCDFKRWTKLLSTNLHSYEDCVKQAKKVFVSWYRNFVIQLLHNYPIDARDKKDGKLFWSAPKKLPHVIHFDSSNELHISFIQHLSALFAFAYGITSPAPSLTEIKVVWISFPFDFSFFVSF
eukprot:TRINITY_DN1730_c0_g1_i28.p1 TRINITY_DN1730_c0_g1~~TRINITY_DN1730_c0_g1_i28.p1  ORF type:complete len:554 (-),score=93.57 TRINITY_DN1730_c0_g1_i28:2386-4047(-)